ncbi:hypothetical protein [Streptomyces phage phiScoe3]|nr:hypothetical protein [Streptomyces phage phiScoe3]
MTREEIFAAVRERHRQNPPPPPSDEQIVKLRQLLGTNESAPLAA